MKSPKKCIVSCKDKGFQYFNSNYECMENIPPDHYHNYGLITENCSPYNTESNNCIKPSTCIKIEIEIDGNGDESESVKNEDSYTYFKIQSDKCIVDDIPEGSNEIKYHSEIGEIFERCPKGLNFIGENGLCQDHCQNYYEKNEESGSNGYYTYKCLSSCSVSTTNNIHYIDEKECIQNCDYYLYDNGADKICYPNCENKFYSINEGGKNICTDNCGTFSIESDQVNICKGDCNFLSKKIKGEEDNDTGNFICLGKCSQNVNNIISQIDENGIECISESNCSEKKEKNSLGDYVCKLNCEKTNKIIDKECFASCDTGNNHITKNGEYYICSESCSQDGFTYNYYNEDLCINNCDFGDYIINNEENTCIRDCKILTNNNYFFFEYDSNLEDIENALGLTRDTCIEDCSRTKKPYTRENKHCDIACVILIHMEIIILEMKEVRFV